MKLSKKRSEYLGNYIKNNYKRHEIKLKEDEETKLQKVLKNKKLNIREYIMQKIEEDLRGIK